MGNTPGKTTAIVAYLTLVGALIAITMNMEPKHEFARFHTRQAFGLHLSFHGVMIFLSVWPIEYAWYGFYIAYLVLWTFGFSGAIIFRKRLVPLVGKYFQSWFTFIP